MNGIAKLVFVFFQSCNSIFRFPRVVHQVSESRANQKSVSRRDYRACALASTALGHPDYQSNAGDDRQSDCRTLFCRSILPT